MRAQTLLLRGGLIAALLVGGCTRTHAASKPTTTQARPPPAPPEDREDVRHRRAWWNSIRSGPAGLPSPKSYSQARSQWLALPHDVSVTATLSPPGPKRDAVISPPWSSIGPATYDATAVLPDMGIGVGRGTAVAIDPTNSRNIYLGFAMGGVWKSADGGTTWAQITPDSPSLAVGAILIDPGSPNTLWVGTGEGNLSGDAYYGQGLLKTTDGGATWSVSGATQFTGSAFTQLVLDPTNGDVYASTDSAYDGFGDPCYTATDSTVGLWRSKDAGTTWTLLSQGSYSGFSVDFGTSPPRKFLVTDAYYGLYQYDEATGLTNAVPSSMPTSTLGMVVSRAPSNPSQLYAGVGQYGSAARVFASSNGGVTWTSIGGAPDFCGAQCEYDDVVTVHPTSPGTIYLGGSLCPIWKGTGLLGGAPVWTPISMPGQNCAANQNNWWQSAVHADVHRIVVDPADSTVLYANTDNGLVRGHNDGASWDHFANMPTLQFYALCIDPNDPTRIFGGMQDNGSGLRNGATSTWIGVLTGDGGHCVVNRTSSNLVLLSGDNGYVYQATDGFAVPANASYVFDTAAPGCSSFGSCGDRIAFIPPFTDDPSSPNTVYLGTHRLWRSTDFGSTWSPFTGDLTGGASGQTCLTPAAGDYLTAIAIDSTGTIYTGSAGGHVFKVPASGSPVVELTKTPLPGRFVTAVAIDPTQAQTLYVSFGGFNAGTPASPGHVFKSVNGGQTWTVKDPPQFDMPIYQLITHPTRSSVLFASTDFGVMASPDSGATWGQLGTSLPPATVAALVFQPATSTLLAGTHGRSAWALTFGTGPTVVSVTPNIGPTGGGQSVTIAGTGFWTGMSVSFGGTAATGVQVASLTSAQVTTPPHATGTVDVTVLNIDGSTARGASAYQYSSLPPSLTSVSPSSGPASGGTAVTVSGSNFVSGVQVTFGGATATVSGSTTGSISCVTPPGTPGAVDLVVTNPDGRTANLTGGFTYLAAGDAGTTNHPGGCGCQTPGSAWVWGAAVATIALRRRRSLDG